MTPTTLGSSIYSGVLGIAPDGTTLIVTGTKNVPISGETGSGDHYVAVFPNFFTSTLNRTVVAY
ncbi:hypothetical protein [Corallococcus sp. RDP092CA]|uniref:hypothetical protein n=1 Tax=Corallococcus sp. RDP092CA TaxID=3109369 RepID=UPI0035AF665D